MIDLCTVNYNSWHQLMRQIRELSYHNGPRRYRHYIMDNKSTGLDKEMLKKALPTKYEESVDRFGIELLEFNGINLGYASACNELAAIGSSPIIGLLNADVWLTNDDLLQIEKTFYENPEIDILGPKQRDEAGRITHAGIFGTNTQPKLRAWREHDPADARYRELEESLSISGSAYFVRRNVWQAIASREEYHWVQDRLSAEGMIPPHHIRGGFLPTRHYYEETFFSYYAKHLGHKIYYAGNVSIGHSWHASHPIGSPQDKLFKESQATFRRACDLLGIAHD